MIRILFFVLVLFLFSCRKNNLHEENISGIVLHTLTLQPLGNQKVTITVTNYLGIGNESSEFPNGQPFYRNEKFTLITNSEGKFELTVSVHDDWIYSAELERGEYELLCEILDFHSQARQIPVCQVCCNW